MAELALIMSMITVTSTAANILGVIKRRCGACQTITQLANRCEELVDKIRILLKTLEGDAYVPCDTRRISTALSLRREEFDAILKNLEKIKRRTKRTHPVDRTEKFIKAQGWAKNMEAIYNDLVHVRNGIENIVSNWDVVQFVATKFEGVATIDATKSDESGNWKHHATSARKGSGTVNFVDRIQTTIVKLTKANKEALNRYGNLDELSLADALFEASLFVAPTDETCFIQLRQRSAELLHPASNVWMGRAYKYGFMMEKDIKSALFHFRAASSRGDISSTMELIGHYNHEHDTKNLFKYVKPTSSMATKWINQILLNYYPIGYNFEDGELEQHLITESQSLYALGQSYAYFFGAGRPMNDEKAIEALPSFDSGSYSVQFDAENSTSLDICLHHYGCDYRNEFMHEYLDFLFESNQFLPFLIWSYYTDIYSPQHWKRRALHAANNRCVDAHIFLAEFYSSFDHRNEREMKNHLRIAADAGHSQAQSMCRQLFGKRTHVCKGVKRDERKLVDNQEKETHSPHSKQSEKEGDTRKRRARRASNKYGAVTK